MIEFETYHTDKTLTIASDGETNQSISISDKSSKTHFGIPSQQDATVTACEVFE